MATYQPPTQPGGPDNILSDEEKRVAQIDWNNERYKNMPFNPWVPEQRDKALQYAENIDQSLAEGRPQDLKFVSNRNPDGSIKDVYKLNNGDAMARLDGVNLNKEGLAAIRARALGTGDSPWLKLQMEKQGHDETNALNANNSQANANYANAFSGLASRGGISSGARERLARASMNDSTLSSQNVRNAGMGNRLGLQIADENTKTDLLKSLPGMETQASTFDLNKANNMNMTDLEAQKYNIGNALNDSLQSRAFDSNQYNEKMRAWGALKTSEAQEGKK